MVFHGRGTWTRASVLSSAKVSTPHLPSSHALSTVCSPSQKHKLRPSPTPTLLLCLALPCHARPQSLLHPRHRRFECVPLLNGIDKPGSLLAVFPSPNNGFKSTPHESPCCSLLSHSQVTRRPHLFLPPNLYRLALSSKYSVVASYFANPRYPA